MTRTVNRCPVTERLTPSPDGTTVDFQTSQPYAAGTVSVYINGLRKIASWCDGFEELGGSTIRLMEPPLLGDSVQARYDPA